jgi:hypothetical protein
LLNCALALRELNLVGLAKFADFEGVRTVDFVDFVQETILLESQAINFGCRRTRRAVR